MNLIYPQLDGVKINPDRSLPYTLIQAIRKAYDYISQVGNSAVTGSVISTQSIVTANRVLNTTYQNLTGLSMFVTVSAQINTGGIATGTLQAATEIGNPPLATVAEAGTGVVTLSANEYALSFWVLPGNYYAVYMVGMATFALTAWTEWT